MVARRHSPLTRLPVAEEAVGLEHGRRRREEPGAEVQGGSWSRNARAAASGVEVGHLRVVVPPRSEHRTVLADEERAPPRHALHQRHARCAERFASAPFQSEISDTSASSTSFRARATSAVARETPKTHAGRSNSGRLSRRSRSSCVQVGDQSKR